MPTPYTDAQLPDVAAGIIAARQLAEVGVPVFVARAIYDEHGQWDPTAGTSGYQLPPRWEQTPADPAIVDTWRAGDALAAVMGHGLDGVDVDSYKAGDPTTDWRAAGQWPHAYGRQETPSGGYHELVNALGVRTRDAVLPGVDVKAGIRGEGGHNFLWIAPTLKISRVTGDIGMYRWTDPPRLDEWAERRDSDDSGGTLAERIRALRATKAVQDTPHAAWDAMTPEQQDRVRTYLQAVRDGEAADLAAVTTWPEGHTDERGRGWQKTAADLANRLGRLARADWTPWTADDARAVYDDVLPGAVAAAVNADATWRLQADRRDPAVMPAALAESLEDITGASAMFAAVLARQAPQGVPAATPGAAHSADGSPSATGALEAPQDSAAALVERKIAERVAQLAIEDAARRRWRVLSRPAAPPFDMGTLGEILARPADPPARIAGLLPWEASALIVAQRKTGKTSVALNLAHSLITGAPFLSRFDVLPVAGTVALLNYEVSANLVANWAAKLTIPDDRLILVNLRGRRNPLGTDEDRGELAARLRSAGVESLIVDPFGRAYTGESQDNNGEVSQWLVGLDEFARAECGAKDLILTAHAGWQETARARGASALEDWPDSLMYMTRNDDSEEGEKRFFRATGRDVEVDEDEFLFDNETHLIRLTGHGSAKESKQRRTLAEMAVIACRAAFNNPGITKAGIIEYARNAEDWPSGRGSTPNDRNVRKAIDYAVRQGRMTVETGGVGGASRHWDAATPGAPQEGAAVPTKDVAQGNYCSSAEPLQYRNRARRSTPLHNPPYGGYAGCSAFCSSETDGLQCSGCEFCSGQHVDRDTGEVHDAAQCPGGRGE